MVWRAEWRAIFARAGLSAPTKYTAEHACLVQLMDKSIIVHRAATQNMADLMTGSGTILELSNEALSRVEQVKRS